MCQKYDGLLRDVQKTRSTNYCREMWRPYNQAHISWHRNWYEVNGVASARWEASQGESCNNRVAWPQGRKKKRDGIIGWPVTVRCQGGPPREKVCEEDHCFNEISSAAGSFIRLNAEIRSDLQWWHKFMEQWNRIGLLPNLKMELITLETVHLATGDVGLDSHWLQWEWNSTMRQWSIAPFPYCVSKQGLG